AVTDSWCTGRMPALRIRSLTSRFCSGVCTVMTVPDSPARAVRPERCRYALCSTGGSAWTTRATSSTWMPRAAMSVHTIVVAVPVHRVHAAGGELAGQVLRSVLGAGEHDRAARRGGQVAQHVEAGGGGDLEHVVLHGPHGARGRIGGVGDRLVQELLDQLVH